jgi:hypothetical protein
MIVGFTGCGKTPVAVVESMKKGAGAKARL